MAFPTKQLYKMLERKHKVSFVISGIPTHLWLCNATNTREHDSSVESQKSENRIGSKFMGRFLELETLNESLSFCCSMYSCDAAVFHDVQ